MNEVSRLRLVIVGVVVMSLFAALLGRLWYLQVLDSPTFVRAAVQNQGRLVCEPAPRGRILDRNGVVLVDNAVSQAVTLDRTTATRHPEVVDRLAGLLGLTTDAVGRELADPRYSPFKPVPIEVAVPFDKVAFVMEHADNFPGVQALALHERAYPMGTRAANLLGYVGQINAAELKDHQPKAPQTDQAVPTPTCPDYGLGDGIGKGGVEEVYDQALRGHPGVDRLEVDRRGRVLRVLSHSDPVPGLDLYLTLDANVQKAAEESLVQGLDQARTHKVSNSDPRSFTAPAGAVTVLDPRDGSVLALASYPTYDPAKFVNGISQTDFDQLNNDPNHPLVDRAIAGQYAPGSTFKLVTATAALQKGLITPDTTIVDTGSYTIGGKCSGSGCQKHNSGNEVLGRVNLPQAITKSSDVYFYGIGDHFWQQRGPLGTMPIQDEARAFGLDQRTGIPLSGEAPGRVSDPDRRKQDHAAHPGAFPEANWFAGDNANLAIGQGETLVSPLQLASAYATFANGGTVYQPRIALKQVRSPDGTTEAIINPTVRSHVDLPPTVRQPILQGLQGVVGDPTGTAYRAFQGFPLTTFPLAGKTGTAQVSGKQDTSVFVAFGPVDAPQFTVSVILEQAGFGADAAAPVARRIFEVLAGQAPGQVRLQTGGTSA